MVIPHETTIDGMLIDGALRRGFHLKMDLSASAGSNDDPTRIELDP